jgi:hypothetical protein
MVYQSKQISKIEEKDTLSIPFPCTLGFTKNNDLISGLIRRGIITSRDEALARLERDNVFDDDALRELLDEIGLHPALRQNWASPPNAH